MKSVYVLLIIGLLGCSSGLAADEPVDSGAPFEEGADCDGVPEPISCTRTDGLSGHCVHGQCVITCSAATECPSSICRVALCANSMCQFVGVNDGVECTVGDLVGRCESYECVMSD